MGIKRHPDFDKDLTALFHQAINVNEMIACVEKALNEIEKYPAAQATLKRPPLKGLYKKKFFSVLHPAENLKPDLRIVYQYLPEESVILLFAVVRENSYGSIERRDQSSLL
ncbi:type II toxin-antitoxin system RelE/ParE family toxin [Desmospora activa]|uniref:ParE-like toxin of type II ParDE toxin-antitoxin system n=1 Tax=Desmospora activa DSM 45169 TaxID=1121389 RepID=A0A2T4Z4K9_9BACL|nr:type II toxin-antitoxin system RelE/ParE family toxin [Desmospora activa]PTM56828.1 ParE-like toxin of type II ParDE toxin-antitoxin system [Desmospora activa DSM 45169]